MNAKTHTQPAAQMLSTHPFVALNDHHCICLTTFRKDGTPVETPVTFAQHDSHLYVITGKQTGKIKRIQRTARVMLAPCDTRGNVLGASMEGRARILPDDEAKALRLKFKAPAPLMFIFNRLRELRSGGNVYLEIASV